MQQCCDNKMRKKGKLAMKDNRPLVIGIVAVGAIIILSLLLIFSDKLVGRAFFDGAGEAFVVDGELIEGETGTLNVPLTLGDGETANGIYAEMPNLCVDGQPIVVVTTAFGAYAAGSSRCNGNNLIIDYAFFDPSGTHARPPTGPEEINLLSLSFESLPAGEDLSIAYNNLEAYGSSGLMISDSGAQTFPMGISDLCEGINCGTNKHCDASTGVCVCDEGYLVHETECVQCLVNDDCNLGYSCKEKRCVNLCEGVSCGDNAQCELGDCVCDEDYEMKDEVCELITQECPECTIEDIGLEDICADDSPYAYLCTSSGEFSADLNGDGMVNEGDVAILKLGFLAGKSLYATCGGLAQPACQFGNIFICDDFVNSNLAFTCGGGRSSGSGGGASQ